MTDFAALLAKAELVEKPFTRAGYTGPIHESVVAAVQMIIDNDKPLFIPVASEEEFEGLAEQFVAQARKLDKTASATKVWADPKEKTSLKALKVSIGAKRGRKEKEETAAAAPAEAK